MKGYAMADLEKARNEIYTPGAGGGEVITAAASSREGKTFVDTKKTQKAPTASPEPMAWIKEVEKRQAAIAPPTGEDDNDDDMEWGNGLPQILLTL